MIDQIISQLTKKLERESLAPSTIKNYLQASKRFLEYFGDKDFSTLNQDNVAAYIRFLEDRKHLKPQTVNIDLNAISFLMEKILRIPIDMDLIPRKRRPMISIPDILSPSEIKMVFEKITYEKHKVMLMLIYGCGMTRSQLCQLKIKDINYEHKQVRVPAYNRLKSSGLVALPDKVIPLLLRYLENDKPVKYLFEGRKPGQQYSTFKIVNYALSEAMQQTGIQKNISLKDLRHCYAIHLRDHGYPIESILENWGTSNSTTYKRYCQMGIIAPKFIPSPLDLLYDHDNIDPMDETVVRNLISFISTDDEKNYFNEAAKCMKVGALRASVLLIWEAAIRNIQQRCLRYSKGLNEALKKHYPKAKEVESMEDFAYIKESLVLQASNDIGIFDKNEKETLKDCLDLRNHCGHPSNYSPGTQKVMAFLEDIIRILYK